jgi:hypothetical protein
LFRPTAELRAGRVRQPIAFAEETFGIRKGSRNAGNVRADDLSYALDFTQTPRPFVQIGSPKFSPAWPALYSMVRYRKMPTAVD